MIAVAVSKWWVHTCSVTGVWSLRSNALGASIAVVLISNNSVTCALVVEVVHSGGTSVSGVISELSIAASLAYVIVINIFKASA